MKKRPAYPVFAFGVTVLIVLMMLFVDFAPWERFTVAGSGISIVTLFLCLTRYPDGQK